MKIKTRLQLKFQLKALFFCSLLLFTLKANGSQENLQNNLSQVHRLLRQGALEKAEQVLLGLPARQHDRQVLRQLLSLQLRLAHWDGVRQSLEDSRRLLGDRWYLPETGQDFQLLALCASAYDAMNQEAEGKSLWASLLRAAKDQRKSHSLLLAYRQIRKFEEAISLTTDRRRLYENPSLWGLEMASIYESMGQIRHALDELFLYQQFRGGTVAEQRILKLLEKQTGEDDLFPWLRDKALADLLVETPVKAKNGKSRKGRVPSLHPVAQTCLAVFRQFQRDDHAFELAWKMDDDESGQVPFHLAETLLQDGRDKVALDVMDELRRLNRPICQSPSFMLHYARGLAGTGRVREALPLLNDLARRSSTHALTAHQEAADLLDYRLHDHAGALRELAAARILSPDHRKVGLHQLDLLVALSQFEEAHELEEELRRRFPRKDAAQIDLLHMRLRMAWQAGSLTEAAQSLKELLGPQAQHNGFNEAIEWMDLFAFAPSDSFAVTTVGQAEALHRLGQTTEAIYLLKALPEGPVSEWLSWRVCVLADRALSPELALGYFEDYRQNYPESYRLDLLDWMICEQSGRRSSTDELQCLETFLHEWPESLLQERVRRRFAELSAQEIGRGEME